MKQSNYIVSITQLTKITLFLLLYKTDSSFNAVLLKLITLDQLYIFPTVSVGSVPGATQTGGAALHLHVYRLRDTLSLGNIQGSHISPFLLGE